MRCPRVGCGGLVTSSFGKILPSGIVCFGDFRYAGCDHGGSLSDQEAMAATGALMLRAKEMLYG